MKETKYRVWDIDHKKMHEVAGINFRDKSVSVFRERSKTTPAEYFFVLYFDEEHYPKTGAYHPGIVMQFIGLNDKKDTDMYEDDVLKGWNGTLYQIVLQHGAFRFWDVKAWRDGHYDAYLTADEMGDIEHNSEVVGNIHENPKLLEGK